MSETNGYVTRDQLLRPTVRRFDDVEIDGLGKFRIRTLTAREYAEYEAEKISSTGKLSRGGLVTHMARLIVLCVVDGDGNQIFGRDDVRAIQELDASQVRELADACKEFCGFEDAEAEAEKN